MSNTISETDGVCTLKEPSVPSSILNFVALSLNTTVSILKLGLYDTGIVPIVTREPVWIELLNFNERIMLTTFADFLTLLV
jgi:hypothetical protein